jgi:hypothetical protein
MIRSKLIIIGLIIATNLIQFNCHKRRENPSPPRNEWDNPLEIKMEAKDLPYVPDLSAKSLPFLNDSAYNQKDLSHGRGVRNPMIKNEEHHRRRPHYHHNGPNDFLSILGLIFLILIGLGLLFLVFKLINRFLSKRNKKEYDEWKKYKLEIDNAQRSKYNGPNLNVNNNQNVNRQANHPNINNSNYSYINLERSIRNDFNYPC